MCNENVFAQRLLRIGSAGFSSSGAVYRQNQSMPSEDSRIQKCLLLMDGPSGCPGDRRLGNVCLKNPPKTMPTGNFGDQIKHLLQEKMHDQKKQGKNVPPFFRFRGPQKEYIGKVADGKTAKHHKASPAHNSVTTGFVIDLQQYPNDVWQQSRSPRRPPADPRGSVGPPKRPRDTHAAEDRCVFLICCVVFFEVFETLMRVISFLNGGGFDISIAVRSDFLSGLVFMSR